MSKSVGIWVIAITLVVFAGYCGLAYAFTHNHGLLFWVVGCIVAALGLVNSKPWSQYVVYFMAIFAAGSWLYQLFDVVTHSWWDAGIINVSATTLVEHFMFVLVGILFSAYIFRYFRKKGVKT